MIVFVKFKGTDKLYGFNTNLNLVIGAKYDIVADSRTIYNNYVEIVRIVSGTDKDYRTITDAKLISMPPKPKKPYHNIYVNEKKRTICVVWKDGTKTTMKPHEDDEFDIEKGIALCFMKKVFGNRGCYYDTFRDITEM